MQERSNLQVEAMYHASNAAAASSTIETVAQLVAGIRAKQAPAAPLGPADSLTDAGVSSLDMVNLMLAVEASFDLFIPSEMIGPESFRSIDSIASMVETIRARA